MMIFKSIVFVQNLTDTLDYNNTSHFVQDKSIIGTILTIDVILIISMLLYFGLLGYLNYVLSNWWVYVVFSLQILLFIVVDEGYVKSLSQIFILWCPYLYQLRSSMRMLDMLKFTKRLENDYNDKIRSLRIRVDLLFQHLRKQNRPYSQGLNVRQEIAILNSSGLGNRDVYNLMDFVELQNNYKNDPINNNFKINLYQNILEMPLYKDEEDEPLVDIRNLDISCEQKILYNVTDNICKIKTLRGDYVFMFISLVISVLINLILFILLCI
jgi:hypothetical protein